MRRVVLPIFAVLVIAAVAWGCAPAASEHPAVEVIEDLLELRRNDERDPEAYEPFFLEPELATAIAEGSGETTRTPRVPEWEPPYLSEETSSTASVVVIWKPDDSFPDWPAVNIFMLTERDERWYVVDAIEATEAPKPLTDKDDQ